MTKREKALKEDAREEGRVEGRAEIRAELNEFKLLNKCLLKAKRYSDLERATATSNALPKTSNTKRNC